MDGGKITINFDDSPMENEEVKELSILIDNVKDDFEKDEYLLNWFHAYSTTNK